MIGHQYTHQVEMIRAECTRNTELAKNQFEQQASQAVLALDQQKQQQEMQLKMAQQQRAMAIQQQAAQMQAQATQMSMQMEMQKKMANLYSGAGTSAADAKPTTGGAGGKATGAKTK